MKKQLLFLVTNILFFTWIDRFFSGFISVKLPFSLTQGFKVMSQSGLNLQDLDVSYVSSLSWYILATSGLSGILSLALGTNMTETTESAILEKEMTLSSPVGMQEQRYNAARECLNLATKKWDLEGTELRILKFHNYG
ncbi:uncharacterized protein LOC126319862 [Schistocerca gregaria]|uniref:uncharacterized protein LOC126319862 n=1 Tax=Schistocerca gregaria TaxID=7010 RepID=UPI00211F1146|nr:uncharacterized protein LOC126319862 [Schistocerca gregaria]